MEISQITKIGIDFSITSPSVTILKDGKYHFISFFDVSSVKKDWKNSKKFKCHQDISDFVEIIPYKRNIDKSNYRTEQQSKLEDAKKLGDLICKTLEKYIDENTVIGLEGFSYGSISNSTLDLCLYGAILRLKLSELVNISNLIIISPPEAKKRLSDKGNANKYMMIDSFISNRLEDEELTNCEFWKFCSSNELDYKDIKPIDDLCDSYGILKSI